MRANDGVSNLTEDDGCGVTRRSIRRSVGAAGNEERRQRRRRDGVWVGSGAGRQADCKLVKGSWGGGAEEAHVPRGVSAP